MRTDNISHVAKSLDEARREAAERTAEGVAACERDGLFDRDPHAGEMAALITIADHAQLRGLPAVGPLSGGSAIRGTQPGENLGLFDDA